MTTVDPTRPARVARRVTLAAASAASLALLVAPVSGPPPSAARDSAQGVVGADRLPRTSRPVAAPRSVTAGSRFGVRITVPTRGATSARRPVSVHHRAAGSTTWTLGATGRTDRRGRFSLRLVAPAEPTVLTVRLVAPRHGRAKPVRRTTTVLVAPATTSPSPTATPTSTPTTSPTGTPTTEPTATPTPTPTVGPTAGPTDEPTVDPTPTGPLGDPDDWTYILSGEPARWDPCEAVTWSYDPAQQPYVGAEADMTTAFAMVAGTTGLTFTRVPLGEAAFTVRWSTPAETPALEGSVVGIGGPSMSGIDPDANHGTRWAIVRGQVVLDATGDLPPGHGHLGWGQVMVHEIGHAVGLGHATGYVQVMAPMVSTLNTAFGAGDLTGLARVGAGQGCLDVGIPRRARTIVLAE